MNRTDARRTAAALLAGLGLPAAVTAEPVPLVAQRQYKPAVQLLGVREVSAPAETPRAAPNVSLDAFDPFAVSPGKPSPPAGDPIDPRMRPAPAKGVLNQFATWTGDRAKAIRTAVSGPPQPQPDPRVGQVASPPAQPLPQQPVPGQPFRGVSPTGRAAYAGNPAYRWYGWGTTTPGANPYAPAGDYPPTSAQWYAMSGATPGAFPVPVTYPFRQPPGTDAPGYATRVLPKPLPVAAPTAVAEVPTGPAPIAETPPFRYVPPDTIPTSTTVVPSVPPATTTATEWHGRGVPLSANTKPVAPPAAAVVEPEWQPVVYTTPAPATTKVGQTTPAIDGIAWQTLPAGPTLQEKVQSACGSAVTAVEVKKLGKDDVIVRFNAPSDAAAERAAKSVSELAELKPFTVTFDVAVNGK